jgi:hypothetical protein
MRAVHTIYICLQMFSDSRNSRTCSYGSLFPVSNLTPFAFGIFSDTHAVSMIETHFWNCFNTRAEGDMNVLMVVHNKVLRMCQVSEKSDSKATKKQINHCRYRKLCWIKLNFLLSVTGLFSFSSGFHDFLSTVFCIPLSALVFYSSFFCAYVVANSFDSLQFH